MGRKKGYSQPLQDSSQSNDYFFSTENSLDDITRPDMPNGHSKKSFLKSWTNAALGYHSNSNGSSSDVNSVGSGNGKIIGASYSHFEVPDDQLRPTLSASSNNNNNNQNRISKSPERYSGVISNGTNQTPLSSMTVHRVPTSGSGSHYHHKKTPIYEDNDNDWSDSVDDIISPDISKQNQKFYPLLDSLHISQPTSNSSNNNSTNLNKSPSLEPAIDLGSNTKGEKIQADFTYPFLRSDYEQLMKDPFSILENQSPPEIGKSKYNKIVKALLNQPFEMKNLKNESWGGIPDKIRPLVWQVLIGYLPANPDTRESVLKRKRREYRMGITQLFQNEKDQVIWHQISIDVPRTNPTIKLYGFETTQRSLEKILYMWAIRHPASGYVQGINDLVTPLFQVFLKTYLMDSINVEEFDPKVLPKELLNCIETDTFWCLTKILDTIQDNYIHEQPGIIRQVTELENLIKRDDSQLYKHFKDNGIEFIQFSFRWMNCMLMREFPIDIIIRMWDTYISDYPTGFNNFHVYVCCAFLRKFSDVLFDMDFQDMIIYLQDPNKTKNWTLNDVEMILSEAFVWQSLYENASAHLKN